MRTCTLQCTQKSFFQVTINSTYTSLVVRKVHTLHHSRRTSYAFGNADGSRTSHSAYNSKASLLAPDATRSYSSVTITRETHIRSKGLRYKHPERATHAQKNGARGTQKTEVTETTTLYSTQLDVTLWRVMTIALRPHEGAEIDLPATPPGSRQSVCCLTSHQIILRHHQNFMSKFQRQTSARKWKRGKQRFHRVNKKNYKIVFSADITLPTDFYIGRYRI